MKTIKRGVQPVGKTGYTDSNHKRAFLRLAIELVNTSKKPFALRKIYHGLRIAGAGFIDLFKEAKQ